jgi:16S rRNA (uracil1498-N3)-methyltransferase
MRLTRVHVPVALAPEARHVIEGAAAAHIVRVLRLRIGDSLTVFDGGGGEYPARIADFGKGTVVIQAGAHQPSERESPLGVTLVQGISRGERMDWVMQKATELGVCRIVPLITERTVVRLDERQIENRLRHWRAIVVGACEQCGRNRVPEVTGPTALEPYLATPSSGRRLMLSPSGTLRVRELDRSVAALALLVGPEGGLSEAEQQRAQAAGFAALRLGPRVLRTETAAIAALTALQVQLGDL